jgi:hypothetical protein
MLGKATEVTLLKTSQILTKSIKFVQNCLPRYSVINQTPNQKSFSKDKH